MKHCKYCNTTKPLSEFYKKKSGKFGVKAECKSCSSIYEKQRWQNNKYIYNKELKKEYSKQWYIKNKESNLIKCRIWSQNNLDKKRIYRANRRAKILKATPLWANKNIINAIYQKAYLISKQSGIQYEVDHIIPLQGKNVCGLHNEFNLQIITMTTNRQKATNYKDEEWL